MDSENKTLLAQLDVALAPATPPSNLESTVLDATRDLLPALQPPAPVAGRIGVSWRKHAWAAAALLAISSVGVGATMSWLAWRDTLSEKANKTEALAKHPHGVAGDPHDRKMQSVGTGGPSASWQDTHVLSSDYTLIEALEQIELCLSVVFQPETQSDGNVDFWAPMSLEMESLDHAVNEEESWDASSDDLWVL
ncbi:MAG: hypothetical protein V3V20_11550 [Algisphaera sp.]